MGNSQIFSYKNQYLKHKVDIQYLYPYHPYRNADGTRNSQFNKLDGFFLDLKDGKDNAINTICDALTSCLKNEENKEIARNYHFASVPSSDPEKKPSPIQKICTRLSKKFGKEDYSQVLQRIKKVPKAATGGDRKPQTHLDSIKVNPDCDVQGEKFILLDDITTTGASLATCANILLEKGADDVICLALGRTTREQENDE